MVSGGLGLGLPVVSGGLVTVVSGGLGLTGVSGGLGLMTVSGGLGLAIVSIGTSGLKLYSWMIIPELNPYLPSGAVEKYAILCRIISFGPFSRRRTSDETYPVMLSMIKSR